MRKKLLSVLLAISIILSAIGVISLGNVFAETAPFTFAVSSASGSDIILDSTNEYKAQIKFNVSARNITFSETITLVKIVNTSTKVELSLGQTKIEEDTSGSWSMNTLMEFLPIDSGKTVVFDLHWLDAEGNPQIEKAELKLALPNPKVKITMEPDALSVAPGSVVTLNYEVLNVGNVALNYLNLTDEAVSTILDPDEPKPIISNNRSDQILEAGEAITKQVQVALDGTLISKPKAVFSYGGKSYEQVGETVTIAAEEIVPTVQFTCSNYSVAVKGTIQTFNYTIVNNNNVTLTNIRVYDSDAENAQLIYGPFDLDAEQEYTGSHDMAVTKSGFYKFKVVYSFEGAEEDKELLVKTDKAIKLPNEVYLKINKIFPEALTEPGELTFTLTIENATNSELRDLVISEDAGLMEDLVLKNIIVPAATDGVAGSETRDVTVNIPRTDTRVKFSLSYTINGEKATTNVNYDVRFDQILTQPTEAPTPTPEQNKEEDDNGDLIIIILLGFLSLLLIAGIIILLVFIKKNSEEKEETVRRKVNTVFDEEENYDEEYEIENDSFNEEYSEEFDDELDDDGVKIYKGKK